MHELNLLPRQRQLAGRHQRLVDLGSTVLRRVVLGLAGVTVAGVVILGSLQVISIRSDTAAGGQLGQAEQELRQLTSQAIDRNQLIETLTSLQHDHPRWTDFIITVVQALPPGTTIAQFGGSNATITGGSSIVATLDGQVPSRTTLGALDTALREVPGVTAVTSPITNLLSPLKPTWHYEVTLSSAQPAVVEVEANASSGALGPGQPAEVPPAPARRFSLGWLVTAVSTAVLVASIAVVWWQRKRSAV